MLNGCDFFCRYAAILFKKQRYVSSQHRMNIKIVCKDNFKYEVQERAATNAVSLQQLAEEYWRIDKFFLISFPILFFIFNIIYWLAFILWSCMFVYQEKKKEESSEAITDIVELLKLVLKKFGQLVFDRGALTLIIFYVKCLHACFSISSLFQNHCWWTVTVSNFEEDPKYSFVCATTVIHSAQTKPKRCCCWTNDRAFMSTNW